MNGFNTMKAERKEHRKEERKKLIYAVSKSPTHRGTSR